MSSRTKCVHEIRVFTTRPRDAGAQFCVRQSTCKTKTRTLVNDGKREKEREREGEREGDSEKERETIYIQIYTNR